MLTKRVKFLGLLILIFSLAITITACESGSSIIDEIEEEDQVREDTYTVSGNVVDVDGEGVEGVILHFSDGFGTAETNENGRWSKSGLEGEVTITTQEEKVIKPITYEVSDEKSNITFELIGEYKISNTDNSGEVIFSSNEYDYEIEIIVEDEEEKKVEEISVSIVLLEDIAMIFYEDLDGNYYPNFDIVIVDHYNETVGIQGVKTVKYTSFKVGTAIGSALKIYDMLPPGATDPEVWQRIDGTIDKIGSFIKVPTTTLPLHLPSINPDEHGTVLFLLNDHLEDSIGEEAAAIYISSGLSEEEFFELTESHLDKEYVEAWVPDDPSLINPDGNPKVIYAWASEDDEDPVDTKYTLTIEIQGEGFVGIHNDEEGESWGVDDDTEIDFEKGTELRLTTNPNDGWEFSHWEGDVTDTDSAETTITMDDDKIVTAHFIEENNDDEIVEFEDPNLEEAIREEINKPEGNILPEDVKDIERLVASDRGIKSIGGIQSLVSLEKFWFSHNEITDISPLANLNNIKELYFWHNKVSDLSPLSNLTSLEKLNFTENEVTDINHLHDLTNLTLLVFDNNEISDIEPLSKLINLKNLHLFDNEISDISSLANLINLEQLIFWNNQIRDISSLENLTNLESLYFGHNEVSDLSPVENLINLKQLSFGHNEVSDISTLEYLTNLELLWLENNEVSDIRPLTNLTNLEWLYFWDNEVSDISPLVKNDGFGDGDEIRMQNNYLDLTEGSDDMDNINTLIDRGVDVDYEPQN